MLKPSPTHLHLYVDRYSIIVHIYYLLFGIPKYKMDRLQRVHNIAARIVVRCPKFTNITPVRYELHWLPIYKRIVVKLLLLVYRSVNQLAPTYLYFTYFTLNDTAGLRLVAFQPVDSLLSSFGSN